jgi:4-amino-4-deoxy-L-arabinose transferase-like glycosyltransferase
MAALLVLVRLAGFGIWDPWEVEVADIARHLAKGDSVQVPHAGVWLVAQGFRYFGVSEWSGRLPIALSALGMLALAYWLVARFADRRAATYTVIVAATSPLFLFNARTMLGEAPSFAIQTAIALCACMAVLRETSSAGARVAWLVSTVALAALGTAARGTLLCALPPIGAAAAVAALDGRLRLRATDKAVTWTAYAICLLALGLATGVARAVLADSASFSPWLGGQAQGGQPPGFDAIIERVFHAFAPWAALLPLALTRLVAEPNPDAEHPDDERRLRLFLLAWSALGYAALTLYVSRYGHKAALLPVAAFAAAVALLLRDLERSRASHWPTAIAALFLSLLILRDFALYPNGPVHGMAIADFDVPKVFNPRRAWAAVMLPFSAVILFAFGAGSDPRALDLRAPYRFLAQQWRRGLAFRLWLVALALVLLGLFAFGVAAWVPFSAGKMSTIGIKVGKVLMLVPFALPVVLVLGQLALYGCARLGTERALPILLAGLCVGGYAGFGFMSALSSQFSPREVYDTYNKLAGTKETLIEYKVGARAAAYYAKGDWREVETINQLVDQLAADKPRWAMFPGEELAAIDRQFRDRTQRHLFVADARNDRAMLASNRPVPGRKDENVLSRSVLHTPPKISHPVEANFDDKVMLLGYDLKLPHGDHVGAGEHFDIVWYFKALKSTYGNYKIFVHIDGGDQRINGDHDPVDGKYPVRLWSEGDIIVDEQRLDVPASYPSAAYTIYLGFYAGETRLTVKEGPKDDANRVNAGVLRIR